MAPLVSLTRLLLGVSELQLGWFGQADATLVQASLEGRSQKLKALSSGAGSALATSQLIQGREHVALELTDDTTARDRYLAYGDLDLVRAFALLQSRLPVGQSASSSPAPMASPTTMHPADEVGASLSRVHHARSRLLEAFVADAERLLDAELVRGRVRGPVCVLVLVELALCAAVAHDLDRLTALHHQLQRAGATGEAAFVAALRADVAGDDRTAIAQCSQAVGHSTCLQPPVAAMARVVRSQLLHASGRRAEAQADLGIALTTTAVRRNALPFWGWSRNGSTVLSLLEELPESSRSGWTEELRRGLMDNPGGIASLAGPLVATAQERADVAEGQMPPTLSPRERGVLRELARGATYADIAATLHLSENTVKTHVSRVYSKLGVGRRSDALAAARTMDLI
jgi:DNA-binding CsgD family transcriptional regulator